MYTEFTGLQATPEGGGKEGCYKVAGGRLTMRNEYPIQRLLQPRGHGGMDWSWLCTAAAWAGASHTAQRLMYGRISSSESGIMGSGAALASQ